jgi:hypothetical protein
MKPDSLVYQTGPSDLLNFKQKLWAHVCFMYEQENKEQEVGRAAQSGERRAGSWESRASAAKKMIEGEGIASERRYL